MRKSRLQTLSSSHIIIDTTSTLVLGPVYWLHVEELLMLSVIFPLLSIFQTRCARCELSVAVLFKRVIGSPIRLMTYIRG